LSFAGVSNGALSFYVASAGHEAATSLAFNLDESSGPEGTPTPTAILPGLGLPLSGVLATVTSVSVEQVGQLLSFSGTALDLVATLLTVSVVPGPSSGDTVGGGNATATVAGIGPATATGVPQGQGQAKPDEGSGSDQPDGSGEEAPESEAQASIKQMPPWARLAIGLDRAWEQARGELMNKEGVHQEAGDRPTPVIQPKPQVAPKASPPGQSTRPSKTTSTGAIDAAIDELGVARDSEPGEDLELSALFVKVGQSRPDSLIRPVAAAVALSAGIAAGLIIKTCRDRRKVASLAFVGWEQPTN
jgi:hypothetical protein